jgi:hypothetical protein
MCDGEAVTSGVLTLDVPTWQPNELVATAYDRHVPYVLPENLKTGAEYFLNVSFRLKEDSQWAEKGHITSRQQFKLPLKPYPAGVGLSGVPLLKDVSESAEGVVITGESGGKSFRAAISSSDGLLHDYSVDGKKLVNSGPTPNFYRALTDNDIGGGSYGASMFGAYINNAWRTAGTDRTVADFTVTRLNAKSVKVTASGLLNSKAQTGGASRPSPYTIEYTIYGNGDVVVNNKVSPNAESYDLGMVGGYLRLPLEFKNVEYFGRGPIENYIDRYYGNDVGLYKTTVDGMFVNRQRPMEMGNRIGTRWVSVTNDEGFGLLAVAEDEMEFSALRHTADDLSTYSPSGTNYSPARRHPTDLNEPTDVILNLNHVQMGVGSENWQRGPYGQAGTLNYGDFMVRKGVDYDYTYTLRPIFPGESGTALSKTLVTGAPMLSGILVGGAPLEGFSEKTASYDYPLSVSEPFPTVSAVAYDGVSVSVDQASVSRKNAVIHVSRATEDGMDEAEYIVNFVRDANFLTDILLDGTRITDYNAVIRDYTTAWPGDSPMPVVSAASAPGVDAAITQPTPDSPKAVIVARNAYDDVQTYTITLIPTVSYDSHRPSVWGRPLDLRTLPLGPVRFKTFSAPINANNYYYVNNPPTSGTARGDVPFVGLYPNRFLQFGDSTADVVAIDETTGKKVYVHKNTAGTGNANRYGDTLVGLEARNTANIAGQTLVMHAKLRPVSGSFALSFRSGNNEARNAAEIFKVAFTNTGIRYSTTTTTNGSANSAVADAAMTAWQTTLDRSLYYEVWMLDTPNAPGSDGHNVMAFVKYTDAQGREVSHSSPLRRQTTASTTSVDFATFSLYDGNTTSSVNIEAFEVFVVNPGSPLITFDVSGPTEAVLPDPGESAEFQLSATAIHNAEDKLPLPYLSGAKWEILNQDGAQGVSIDQTGKASLTGDFAGEYFDVRVSGAEPESQWAPVTYRVNVVPPPPGIKLRERDGAAVASYYVDNGGETASSYNCIIALYDSRGRMVDYGFSALTVEPGGRGRASLALPSVPGATARAYVWDSEYLPVFEAASLAL